MKPTLEQYRTGHASWRREHRGIGYTLSHHGVSDYQPEGTWCYYLWLRPDTFQSADDFALFDRPAEVAEGFGDGKLRQSFDYYSIPDLDFHGGVTWYSKEPYFDPRSGETRYALKIGCDYAHLWDEESGYWQSLDDVEADAKRSIDILADRYPLNQRCEYCGIIAPPDEFYTAVNGSRVHNSQADKFDDGWAAWRPVLAKGQQP